MRELEPLGLQKEWIYESLITSVSTEGDPNCAPMGFSEGIDGLIRLSVYKTSKTCRNLIETERFAVNITRDPELFYLSLYVKESLEYGNRQGFPAPYLKAADAVIFCEVRDREDKGDRIIFHAGVACLDIKNRPVAGIAFNRADSLALECLIDASRVSIVSAEKREQLTESIRHRLQVIQRVAPGSRAQSVASRVYCSVSRSGKPSPRSLTDRSS